MIYASNSPRQASLSLCTAMQLKSVAQHAVYLCALSMQGSCYRCCCPVMCTIKVASCCGPFIPGPREVCCDDVGMIKVASLLCSQAHPQPTHEL